MSEPKSYLVRYEYEYESGLIKKSLEYHGNSCVVVKQESKSEEITIRIPKEMMSHFVRMVDI